MAYFWETLKVLIWKHFTSRKRRYVITIIELIIPWILFTIPIHVKIETQQLIMHLPSHSELDKSPIHVDYTPLTSLTRDLMADVGSELGLFKLNSETDHLKRGYWGVNDTKELANITAHIGEDNAVVVFENLDGETWPDTLKYTIRMADDFSTQTVQISGPPTSHLYFGKKYDVFMKLQWTIDKMYLKHRQIDVNQNIITLQEFPAIDHVSTNSWYVVDILLSCTVFCLLLPFVFLCARLKDERISGMKELMRISGVSSSTLGLSHIINMLPSMLLFSMCVTLFLCGIAPKKLFFCNGGLLFISLFLHYYTVVAIAFPVIYITKSNNFTTLVSSSAYFGLGLLAHYASEFNSFLFGFLPFVPICWFWKEVRIQESLFLSLNFGNMHEVHQRGNQPVAVAFVMMIAQSLLVHLLTWYLDKVHPGQYGVAMPWYFMFQMQFWKEQRVKPDIVMDDSSELQSSNKQYFEGHHLQNEVGIKINNVTKIFSSGKGPKTRALHKLNLKIYKGEITVLLGHNGAGKTTLMSIISGMLGATEGEVYINGVNNFTQRSRIRHMIGFCPQHNVAFSDLSVLENIKFFIILKGTPFKLAEQSAMQLISTLKLEGKEQSMARELSGGMKRRLQLACALAGDADVLILDEPTSGLDVETRRELWNLLLGLRGDHTVLLSTHFMEEADALGDRVAAIHSGRLVCHASPMFLKRAIGTGYRMSLTIRQSADVHQISATILNIVQEVTLCDHTSNTLVYELSAKCSGKFPELFHELEQSRGRLGIEYIGVGLTTLDEVFLKLCSDVDLTDVDATPNGYIEDKTFQKLTGVPLYCSMTWALMMRQMKATWAIKYQYLLFQIILPLLLIWVCTNYVTESNYSDLKGQSLSLDLNIYNSLGPLKVLLDMHDGNHTLDRMRSTYPGLQFEASTDIYKDLLNIIRIDVSKYFDYIIGLKIRDEEAVVWYTTTMQHAAPVALNLLSNILAASPSQARNASAITTVNNPGSKSHSIHRDDVQQLNSMNALIWSLCIGFVLLLRLINELQLPCKEKKDGSRHFQIMSGCPPVLYWTITLLYDLFTFLATCVVPAIVIFVILDKDDTLSRTDFLGALFMLLVVGAGSFLLFVYTLCFFFSQQGCNLILIMIVFISGLLLPIINFLSINAINVKSVVKVLIYMGRATPVYPFINGCIQIVYVAIFKSQCAKRHCNGDIDYFAYDFGGAELTTLILHFAIYGTIVILLEYGVGAYLFEKVTNYKYIPPEPKFHDEVATNEKKYVMDTIDSPTSDNAALIHNLHKKYGKIFGSSTYAVKGTSFSVSKGECFGLLGVNGAGKSTTFKMLTADVAMTRGKLYAAGHYHKHINNKYLYSLGYCPQFGGIDDFLTGAENLRLLLRIRGLKSSDIEKEVATWIQCVGLERYADRPVAGYSGGCQRRLAAAAALATGASVTLLDEPTSGVDTAARRRVWAALRRGLAQNRSIIISSHSMDEMEALCHRIAIMSGGEICALGSPAALRAAHAMGYALRLKLRCDVPAQATGDQLDASNISESLKSIKSDIASKFQSQLQDEHKTLLHYNITDKVPYSELFTFLENLKLRYPGVLEDYSVNETTLEEVFLSYAKENSASPVKVGNDDTV